MVRVPTKTCPNLYRLLDDAEPELLAEFLGARPFQKLSWLDKYSFNLSSPGTQNTASEMLRDEKKDRLKPLEAEAARVITIAEDRGQFVLDGLARTKLDPVRSKALLSQRDQLARSLWAYTREYSLFEAAENSLHLRLYRRYDKHYQTFVAEPSSAGGPEAGSAVLAKLLAELNKYLDRGDGYSIDKFELREDGDEPAAEMYLLFHPDPPTSVREIDEDGNRSRFYFRPPGEAMIVYTPSTGRVHVRAGNRRLRNIIAERFVETALEQTYSGQPVDFQAYDITRFLRGYDLELPELDDVLILRAQVIRADISIGNLANRLSLTTTIDQDISGIINSQSGLTKIFEQAVAIRLVEIAVRYRRAERENPETLDFTLTDRNTSSLLSIGDPFERVLGHRLLRHWKILRDGREPSEAESMAVIPALLAIWDSGAEKIEGEWLLSRGVDPSLLTDLGFLVPAGWVGEDLIDDEDAVGPVAAQVDVRINKAELATGGHDTVDFKVADLKVADGHVALGGNPERYRTYRVRDNWVEQHLRTRLADALDKPSIQKLSSHLLFLGTLDVGGRDVPVYVARGLEREHVRATVDSELRSRQNLGVGLVLQAGNSAGRCIAANVLTPLPEHIYMDQQGLSLDSERLRSAFRHDQSRARGGQTVLLERSGADSGTLFVPEKGSIDITGANRLLVIQRLVDAHNSGRAADTGDLIKGIEDQSLGNIFGSVLWNKLKANFIRSPKRKRWEIAI